jgi:hypothetical protein
MASIDCSLKFICVHKGHALEWTTIRLKPKNPLRVKKLIYDNDEKRKVGTKGEWIVNNLCIGENITMFIPTNKPF